MARYGGARADWIDLSTGINPVRYPVGAIPPEAFNALPTRAALDALADAARAAYGAQGPVAVLGGAQAAIQLVPMLLPAGLARVLSPTYSEHALCLAAGGWRVEEVSDIAALAGADLAVVVNPNNPDGRSHAPDDLQALAGAVGFLVVDESFADTAPHLSVLSGGMPGNVLVLRSFGKFFGLAGLRLGFALGASGPVEALAARAGPWPVSGPAIVVGTRALRDRAWQTETRARLARDAAWLDTLARRAGWQVVGGTDLFRTYETDDGAAVQERLAARRIWVRSFANMPGWIRLGMPGSDRDRARLETALSSG